jgi:competence protein ComEA
MNFKRFVQDYFTFTRNERKGITTLLILIFLFGVANKVIFYFEKPARIEINLLDSASQMLITFSDSLNRNRPALKLFAFNPNTIDSVALDSLDLPIQVKSNLLKFRNRNGKIYSASDFRKIYGVTDAIYSKVEPYLFYNPERRASADKSIVIEEKAKIILEDNVKFENIQIELNTADSISLKRLPGIGEKLSKRIVKYRDLLGGYYSLVQLREVYGLSEHTIQEIEGMVTIDSTKIRKLDLNFSDKNELSKHPYIQKYRAGQIVKFRAAYGSIPHLSVLRDNLILNTDEYNRLKPYF